MRIRTAAFTLLALTLLAPAASAQSEKAKKDVQSKAKKAMESFDLLEFEEAKAGLAAALNVAKNGGLAKDPVTAKVQIDIGIVEFAGLKNEAAAKEAFTAAVAIDPKVQIEVAYKTEGMSDLLESVRKGAKSGGGGGDTEVDPDIKDLDLGVGTEPEKSGDLAGVDCAELEGVDHALVEQGKPGKAQAITARVGDTVGADKVSLFYRAAGSSSFTEVTMERGDGCSYEASIPAGAMKGESVHYYVAAMAGKKALASRGSSSSPNIIELASEGGGGKADDDDPLGGGSVSGGADVGGGGRKKVFVSLALGTGAGYVTGTTEVAMSDVSCCMALALLHLFPEIGYYFSRQMSVSAAFRMGFAVGATVPGHASAAPAGLIRLRYALDESGTGLQVSGAVGGGIIRNTIKVEEAPDGMNIDTTASGPFLIGGGVGYVKPMSGPMNLVAELNGLAAIPGGVEELGTCPGSGCVKPHFGLEFDLNLGILFAF